MKRASSTRLWHWGVPTVALLMLGLILVPAEFWKHPANDATYQGFDPNLIYANQQGDADSSGLIQISPSRLSLSAIPGSNPTVHLITTPLDFTSTVVVRILEAGTGPMPLRIGVWVPRNGSGHFLEFGPPPDFQVVASTIVQGEVRRGLVGGTVVKRAVLGAYALGEDYVATTTLDRRKGIIGLQLTTDNVPPTLGAAAELAGGPADPRYGDIVSVPVPVQGGKQYRFGGTVKLISGTDAYKISIQWLDANLNFLGYANDWHRVQELRRWSREEFTALAPPKTTFARMNLGSGNGTRMLFAGLFLRETTSSTNLISNGDFHRGPEGWMVVGQASRPILLRRPQATPFNSLVTARDAPILFTGLRYSLTASAASRSGFTNVQMTDYNLTLPHARWQVVKINDARARVLVLLLVCAGILMIGWRARRRPLPQPARTLQASVSSLFRIRPQINSPTVGSVAAVLFLLLINALLFNLGSLPFDMLAAKVWAYTATTSGPTALYYLPSTVSLAKVWNGAPYHEAVFPYHPVMAYYFTLIGWIYRLFLKGPGPLLADTVQLELLIKAFNVAFAFADAVLIFLILRTPIGKRAAVVGGALFLVNPAVWMSTSVWGQTHVVSVFPLLASIWLATRKYLLPAWLTLMATALTRPQMLVPGVLFGLVLLRRFSTKENLNAISWTIIAGFLILAPFSWAISPSTPVDILTNQVVVQEAGGNEPALTTVSLGAYSIWPLVSRFASGKSGSDRFYHPSGGQLFGGLTYQRVSLLLLAAMLVIAATLVWRRQRSVPETSSDLFIVALGTVGFLMLKTGLAPSHFVIGLPLLILCRGVLRGSSYYAFVGIWSFTTYSSMLSSFSKAISTLPDLAKKFDPVTNPITVFYIAMHSTDWFITVGILANTLVFAYLFAAAVRRRNATYDNESAG